MERIDIANGIIFQGLGIKIDSFNDRIISQKKIYLLQQLGTELGYTYNWYIRGPYSPSLTTYMYNKLDMLTEKDFSNYRLGREHQDNINKVNSLSNYKSSDVSLAEWYELLASLVYISSNKESWGVTDQNGLFNTLIEHKPQFTLSQCKEAYKVLSDRSIALLGI